MDYRIFIHKGKYIPQAWLGKKWVGWVHVNCDDMPVEFSTQSKAETFLQERILEDENEGKIVKEIHK